MKKLLPQLLMIAAAALWGASFIFTKSLFINNEAITPSIILTGRMLIATAVTIPLLMATGNLQRIRKGDIKYFVLLAFAEPFLYSICETGGVRYLSGSLAAVIVATIPLFVPFAMRLVYAERLRFAAICGVLLSLLGVWLMSRGDGGDVSIKGILLLAAAVVVAVLYTLLLVKVVDRYNPMTITAYQNAIGLCFFAPLMLIVDHDALPLLSFSPLMIGCIAFLGIFCSTLAYMFYNVGMKRLGATAACIYTNIIPVFSLLLALAIGQETFSWLKLAGMLIALLGLFLSQRQ